MDGVWIHFSGLAAGATGEDVEYVSGGLAQRIEIERQRDSASGRFWVASTDDAHHVLNSSNFMALDGSTVRLRLGAAALGACTKVVMCGLAGGAQLNEQQVYEQSRRFGTVCRLEAGGGEVGVWLDSEAAALQLVASINDQRLAGLRVQAYIDSTETEVVVVDDSDSEARRPRRRTGRKSARAAGGGAARKSTGRRRAGARQGTVERTEPAHIGDTAAKPAQRRSLRRVRTVMDAWQWRRRAPFVYEFLYRRAPQATEIDDGCSLSMAWGAGGAGGLVDCYMSQGNVQAATLARDWAQVRQSSDDVASAVTMTSFDLPARGRAASMRTLLAAFASEEVAVLHRNQNKDDNTHAITDLKLRDDGRVLFGCAQESVFVWTTHAIRQRESLLLLDGIDGVYDAGRDHVVANSTRGRVGVWKSGSRNYVWRFSDARRFRTHAADAPRVTALRVAPADDVAYVGDAGGGLALCDFREPYLQRLTSDHPGSVRCIEPAGAHALVVGTGDGCLGLLDTRCVRADARASIVRSFPTPRAQPVAAVRACPHDARVFAAAAGSTVHIYRAEPQDGRTLLFAHEAHQTA
ncbi:hypothetical protein LPJ70_004198, partial [Coemansia sp. RSA 2708]